MYRTLLGLGLVVAIALVVVALTFSASTQAPPDFVFVNGSEPKSLDPHIMTGQPEGRIADALFEGLTYRDPKTLKPTPGSAESWTISPDGKTYRFKIRDNARWSDGTPLTAADFAWSWRRLQRPDLGAEYPYILHPIAGAEAYNKYGNAARHLRGDIASAYRALLAKHPDALPAQAWAAFLKQHHVNAALSGTNDPLLLEVLDLKEGSIEADRAAQIANSFAAEADRRQRLFDHADAHFGIDEGVFVDPDDSSVLVVELRAPTPYFLELTGFYSAFPVPRHVIEQDGSEDNWFLPGKIVSNGPFRMDSWRVNERIRLVKSDTYWNRDAIALDRVDALPIDNANAALNLFLTGEVDWAPAPPPDLVDVLKDLPTYRSAPGMIVYYYRFNCTHPVLQKPAVRQAISMAIDRKGITEGILKAGQLPAYHLVPPGIPGYEQPESALRFDVEAAKALLAEAGHAGGEGVPELRLLYNTSESHKSVAEAVADQLRQNLGLTVKPLNKEWQAYQAATLALDYEIARAGWIGDYLDPNTFLDMWVTNGGNNQTGWADPRYDRLVRLASDVARAAEDPASWIDSLKEPERARHLLAAISSAENQEQRRVAGDALRFHLFREAEAILFQDAFPIMPIYFYVVQSMVQPWVKGWYHQLEMPDGSRIPNLQDIHPLRGISIDPALRSR